MITLTRILFPTDFSERSVYALPYAVRLAFDHGAELHCLHVVDEAYQYWMGMGASGVSRTPVPEDIIDTAQDEMTQLIEQHLADVEVRLVTKVLKGQPLLEIIRYARSQDISLIVLSTHGRSGLSHMLLGSVAEKVVRKSPCPVLTVRHPDQTFVMP